MNKTETQKTYRLVGLAILTALIVVVQVLATFFPMKPVSITLALIPIVIGAALYGKGAGAYLGAVFSVVVVLMCVFGFDAGGAMVWNANPFLCIVVCMLKGTAAGFCSGVVYRAVSKKNSTVAAALAGIVSPIVNTGIFVLGLLIFFRPVLEVWALDAKCTDIVYYSLFILAGINFLIELGVNLIVNPVIVRVVDVVQKNHTK